MQSAFASEQRRRTTFQVARLFMAMLIVVMTLAGLEQSARATQTPTQSWAPPNGAFTVQWQSPWEVHRQEDGMLAVADGSTIAIATTSVPAAEINPSICLEGYIAAVGDPGIDPQSPFMEGKTSWRAYAAFDNLQVGSTDYYECQVTPDGQSLAVFAGGTTMMEKYANIPKLIEFLGQWVVREAGEAGPAVAADGWRLGVVDWVRGTVYQDLGLEPAPAGSDYLVVVADVTNWQANQTDLPLTLEYFDRHMGTPGDDAEFFSQLGILLVGWSSFYNDLTQLEPTPRFADLHARFLAAAEPFSALAYQIEPALDQVLAGQSPAQPLAGHDYQLMTSTVAAIRPALEAVLAEIDALLVEAGFVPLERRPNP